MTAALATSAPSASAITTSAPDSIQSLCQAALDEIHALAIRTFEKIIPCTETIIVP